MEFENPPLELKIQASREVKPDERQPVFWFKKPNGEVFFTREREAWEVMKGRSVVNGKSLKCEYLGMSSGQVYFEGLKEMRKIAKEQGIEKAQDFLRELHDKELETADTSKRPNNQDIMGDSKAIQEAKIFL